MTRWVRIAFYFCMASAMLGMFIYCMTLESVGHDRIVAGMAPEHRKVELDLLKKEVAKPLLTAQQYFEITDRFRALNDACIKADREEIGQTQMDARQTVGSILLLQSEWMEKLRVSSIGGTPEFERVRTGRVMAGQEYIPRDPHANHMWLTFYFVSVFFSAAHYILRLKMKGCQIWTELIPPAFRFPVYAFLWPLGLFRYPKAINPIDQVKKAWQHLQYFASFLVGACISFFSLAPVAFAQKDDSGSRQGHTLHVDVSSFTWPVYLGANGGIFHPAPVQQTSLTFHLPHGFYAGAWNSTAVGDRGRSPNFGNEVDTSFGWSATRRTFDLAWDLTYIDVAPLVRVRGNVFLASGSIGKKFPLARNQTIKPYFQLQLASPAKGPTPRQGVFLHGGAAYSWSSHRFSVDSFGEIVHDSGAFGFDRAFLVKAAVTGKFSVNDHWTVQFPAVKFSAPITPVNDGRRPQLILGGGISYHY